MSVKTIYTAVLLLVGSAAIRMRLAHNFDCNVDPFMFLFSDDFPRALQHINEGGLNKKVSLIVC